MPRKPKAGVAAEHTLTLRMTDNDRALLDKLVALRAAELADLGADEIDVTAASFVRGLIRREAKAKGVTVATAPEAPTAPPAAQAPTSQPKAPTPEDAAAAAAQAALLRAIEKGESQAKIAKAAGVDPGALSKFKQTGSGLSPEKVRRLAKVLS